MLQLEVDTGVDIYPEKYVRGFRPLKEELGIGLSLVIPRFGHSPRIASLKVNDVCNLDCPHCNANKVQTRQMEIKEVFDVLGHFQKAGIQMVYITGGEPTLRPDLPDIIAYSHRLGMLTTVNTNGGIKRDTIDEEYKYWHNLAEKGLFGVTFSYDGTGQKADPRVIHLAAFSVNTLHIYGGISMVVTKENLEDVSAVGTEVMLNNVFLQIVPAVALDGESSASPDNFNQLDYPDRLRFVQKIKDLKKVRGPFANFLHVSDGFLKEVVSARDPNSWHCKNPSSHWVFIDAQGNARVCNERLLSQNYSLTGKENPLLTKEFHQSVQEESQKCRGCSWLCNWEGNRNQLVRGFAWLRLFVTIGSLT
ncbi:MAG: radical SAM protein [Patescibacteria group bacterium]